MKDKSQARNAEGAPKPKLRVLHLEDDANDAELVDYALKAADAEIAVTVASGREKFQAALAAGDFDIILSDDKVPGFSGADALRMAREARSKTPFIFVSGSGSWREMETREQALLAGAILRAVPRCRDEGEGAH